MKSMFGIVFCVSLVAGVAIAMPAVDGAVVRSAKKSLLKPMAFAKTMNDMPMEDRWAIEAEGYLPYESVYDASGRCIKNCAYPGITLREEIERTQRATNQLVYDLCMDNGGTQEECATAGPGGGGSGGGSSGGGGSGGSSSGGGGSGGGGSGGSSSGGGSGGGSDIESLLDSPISVTDVPILQVSSIPGPRSSNNGQQSSFHPGVDMAVSEGTPVYAIYRGTVLFAGAGSYEGGAGCFVNIEHIINGHKYYSRYLHLKGDQEEGREATNCGIYVQEDASVEQGEQIAHSGDTGRGTSAHLHYEMFIKDGNSKPMYIDILGSVQNWAAVNQSRRDSRNTRWFYKEGVERRNFLGRTYIVNDDSTNVMIKNCKANPDSNMPDSGTVGNGCGTGNSNADKVCRCITKSLMGCTGVY